MLPGSIKLLEDRRAPAAVVVLNGGGALNSQTWSPVGNPNLLTLTHDSAVGDADLQIVWSYASGDLSLDFSYASDVVSLKASYDSDGSGPALPVEATFQVQVGTRAGRVEVVNMQGSSGTGSVHISMPVGIDWDGTPGFEGGNLKGTMNPSDVFIDVATGSGNDKIVIGSAYEVSISTGDGSDTVSFGSFAFPGGGAPESLAAPVGGLGGRAVIDLGSVNSDLDWVSTGDGSDSIIFGGRANAWSWGGNDTIKTSGTTSSGSSIFSGSGQDYVSLSNGNDTVYGGDDDDTINLGSGDNRAFGGRGNDSIWGERYSDFISGDEGNDTILGDISVNLTALTDTLIGGEGSDYIRGGRSGDSIIAGMGSDTIIALGGNDTIYGGSGSDYIQDGLDADDRPSGSQSVFAEDGDDTVIGGAGSDTIDFGTGVDYLLYGNPSSGIKVDSDNYLDGRIHADIGGASSTVEKGTLGTDRLLNVPDYLAGTNLSDTVVLRDTRMSLVMGDGDNSVFATGSFDDQYITLGSGRDFVFVDGGDDNVRSGAGDDTLIGGDGNDTLLGEDGDDFIIGDFTSGAGAATDLVLSSLAINDGGGAVTVGGWTLSTATGGDSVLANWLAAVRSSAGNGKDSILAGLGDDIVLSGGGDDTVDGGIGSDVIFGGAGDDLLGGGALDTAALAVPDGGDYLFGEAGDDTLLAGDRDRAVLGGDENGVIAGDRDVAWFSDFTFGSYVNLTGWFRNGPAYGLVSGVTYVVGSSKSDTIVGDAGDNLIFGGDGADSLVGGDGDDLIFGGSMPAGFDSLFSSALAADKILLQTTINAADVDGNDTILGGAGDDCINAGNGNNSIDGGDGDDSL